VGAPVMIVANIYDEDGDSIAVNGDLGTVIYLDEDEIHIELNGGYVLKLEQHTWEKYTRIVENKSWKNHVTGSCTQFPVMLAQAITIHKSQGLSLDNVYLDLKQLFMPGQLYVGLSRVRTFEGLTLSRPLNVWEVNRFAKHDDFQRINQWHNSNINTHQKPLPIAHINRVESCHKPSVDAPVKKVGNYEKILYAYEGLSQGCEIKPTGSVIARLLRLSNATVCKYLKRARDNGVI
jgi:hypothetical protein